MTTIQAESLIPEATLQRLAPSIGGYWMVLGQAADRVTLAYVMNGGHNSITYEIFTCSTEDEVANVCGDAVYDYDPNFSALPAPTRGARRVGGNNNPLELTMRERPNVQGQGHGVQRPERINGSGQMGMNQQQIAAMLMQGQPQGFQGHAPGALQTINNGNFGSNTGNHIYLPNAFVSTEDGVDDAASWQPVVADLALIGPDATQFVSTGEITVGFMGTEHDAPVEWGLFTNN
ncbi:hypothetical protein JDV02_010147 [Purpureocillium takamizusanense]|uniref:Uncharacterized protein n=1 Tax=Purpureocillium takamizusanense TaxID=2060973 RepID=A0A9Q8QRL7_9HYPO|nr:uncharacterized protein JDV02_010147 [Purpureocillium takamizusanense]UNI24398.1 hypothetical protein JDV02_010147 [Purpureocillium takamizusanense]